MYEYRARINRVVDGDTVDVDIELGFDIVLTGQRVRIMGIDTPESRTSDPIEKVFGIAAKNRLKELLGNSGILKTQIEKDGDDAKGKFGRILGDFVVDVPLVTISDYNSNTIQRMVTEIMIEEGHCVPYFGGSKEEVQAQHAVNRQRLIAEGKVILPK
jgi:micrococcal nuclease